MKQLCAWCKAVIFRPSTLCLMRPFNKHSATEPRRTVCAFAFFYMLVIYLLSPHPFARWKRCWAHRSEHSNGRWFPHFRLVKTNTFSIGICWEQGETEDQSVGLDICLVPIFDIMNMNMFSYRCAGTVCIFANVRVLGVCRQTILPISHWSVETRPMNG